MKVNSPLEIVKRYATLKNHRIYSMPIEILKIKLQGMNKVL